MKFTDKEIEELARRIRKMKEHGTHLCCSIGFLTEHQAKMLKEAGLDRINHNLNSSRSFIIISAVHIPLTSVSRISICFRDLVLKSAVAVSLAWVKAKKMLLTCSWNCVRFSRRHCRSISSCRSRELRSENADISMLTTEYCMKVLCLARLLVPKADIRCAAGREVYFKGEEKKLLSVVDSIFASGYLTEGGQGIEDTLKTITDAGFTYEI
jgi:biotin synthase